MHERTIIGQNVENVSMKAAWTSTAAHLNTASLMHAIDRHCMKRRNEWSYRISKTAFRKANRTGKKKQHPVLVSTNDGSYQDKSCMQLPCHAAYHTATLDLWAMARIIMHVSSLESLLILKQMYSHKSAQHNYSGALGCLPMIWDW